MAVSALASWFGSNRLNAAEPGRLLEGCSHVAVPFAGGMSELPHITARTLVVNDLHHGIINLASVAAHRQLGPKLYRRLRRMPFHEQSLKYAQSRCQDIEQTPDDMVSEEDMLEWAENYFVCTWMGRNGIAGTDGEYKAGLSVRWDAAGGDSVVRFQSAIRYLLEFRRLLWRATFVCMDCFDFLEKCKDADGHGLYIDAPWPDDGDKYHHKFTEAQQRQLASVLTAYQHTRIVVRFGDHPLVRELYPPPHWRWHELSGRTAANKAKAEVLLVNKHVVMGIFG